MIFLNQLRYHTSKFDIASQRWIKQLYECMDSNQEQEALEISEQLLDRADELFRAEPFRDASIQLRSQYEIASLIRALVMMRLASSESADKIKECLKLLDMALLMTGCPTYKARILEIISDLHACLMMVSLPTNLADVTLFEKPDVGIPIQTFSMMKISEFEVLSQPGVFRNAVRHWPAISNRSWNNLEYLNRLGGHRLVPVEIGSSYTQKNWTQKIIPFNEFLSSLTDSKSIVYLAQFNLLDHVKELECDISVPDYCYAKQSEEPIINIWMGPRGTVSPCHHDPYDNIFAQIVGYKYIRLFSPDSNLYPYPADQMLSNTSQIDVENEKDLEKYPDFPIHGYQDIILGPGDLLYIPKGWWHYVRSLSVSFSASFWF
jgi:lysine-specific demethylase 8